MEETTWRAVSSPHRGLLFIDQTQCIEALTRLNTMRKEGHLCDAVLEVGSRRIAAHRAVLACTSIYLFERFSMPASSSNSSPGSNSGAEEILGRDGNKHQYVRLDGLDFDSVEVLVNYAYTSRSVVSTAYYNSNLSDLHVHFVQLYVRF